MASPEGASSSITAAIDSVRVEVPEEGEAEKFPESQFEVSQPPSTVAVTKGDGTVKESSQRGCGCTVS